MAKTIINLSDPVSTLVSKTNTISDNVGDLAQLNVGASNDSDLVQAINFLNTNNTDSAAITALIDSAYVQAREASNTTAGIVALLQGDSANGIGLDSSEGRFFVPSNTINTAMLEPLSVTTAKIAADAVDGTKIADDAINSEHYTDGSIDTAHIADLQVTTAKIAADAITGAKIADDAIDSEHYTDGSIDTAHIGDAQVTGAKIAADTVAEANMADDAIGSAQLKTLSTLLIINSSGTTVKTIHGAGA
mgnify:CR=1 FL=1